MSRFGLPSFKLLIAGALAAGAVAYYMGEFPDRAAKGASTTQPTAGKAVRPAKPLTQQRATPPATSAAKNATQPRPTKKLGTSVAKASAPRAAKAPQATETAKPRAASRSPATLTGSIVRTPRPPEGLPTPRSK